MTPRFSCRRVVCLTLSVAVVTVFSAPSQGRTRAYDISEEAAVTIRGAQSLAEGGDINGDGVLDLSFEDCVAEDRAGVVWVLFGPFAEGETSVTEGVANGFMIHGPGSWSHACNVATAGDVNGDGRDDLMVGAPETDHNDRSSSGSIYVVFGKADTTDVELKSFDNGTQGSAGYRIDGAGSRSYLGGVFKHAGVGDINGDGLADMAAGAPFAGASYVIFGKADPAPVDLLSYHQGTHGNTGYVIRTKSPNRSAGYGVAAAGDVNADGTPDVLVGVQPQLSSRGFAYVVFGKTDSEPIDTRELGRHGFEVIGPYGGSDIGNIMGPAGDVNQDGKADLLLCASGHLLGGPGATYVIFGKKRTGSIDLADMGRSGYVVVGRAGRDESLGSDATSLGDVNGDGRPDALIGAPGARYGGKQAGSAFLIYGKVGFRKVETGGLGRRGYRIDGSSGDLFGSTVVGPGDLNEDGVPDLVISASSDGTVYLVWGRR